ncbi:MAG: thiol-disulfide oxidoreductase DCC family protein [Proteobacteria bacterium]|jgi:predicted DCC family thiol-disulfide oxidoreductase YuxK|nr:thiol-disulfide oxidoreductase DCC family protein [Deltaproteobacteria bacterium]RZO43466.1 MAG: thiol-disulfide oxidoreductase DCC family protein [Pseudomonadota bacterium]|tara:strand:+ start:77 stop:472 length:396 start_codon:yes stop_codon:yes gene_type:complete
MPILLFDGHCNLCNAWVNFIVKRDSSSTIRFASLQSLAGNRMLEEHKIDSNYIDSLVLFEEDKVSVSSTAALRILSYLDGWERHLIYLTILPRTFRDLVYRFVAKNRYKWFGRREQCMVPTVKLSKRFLPD